MNYEFTTIKNGDLEVTFLNLGATIQCFKYKGRDLVIGYDKPEDYLEGTDYLGATIGRYANRIENGIYTLNGKTYNLAINNGPNALHGGLQGFDKKIFKSEVDGNTVCYSYLAADMEEGYPGNLYLEVTYEVLEDRLRITYNAKCDMDTIINITNHTYWNLDLENIEDTYLKINANEFVAINNVMIPTKVKSVTANPFDFRQFKKIGQDINVIDEQLNNAGGYDHSFILGEPGVLKEAASFYSAKSKIKVTINTTQKAIQFYAGNFLSGKSGKNGYSNAKREGFALEPANIPNGINIDDSSILRKDELYNHIIEFKVENL